MYQISEHINFLNHNIYSYNQMKQMIFKLGSKKGKKKTTTSFNSPVYRIHY